MKKLCLFVFVIMLAFPGQAQIKKGFIYMKNGTILKGKVLQHDQNGKIKIESAGNIWVFDVSEVDTIKSTKHEPEIPVTKSGISKFSNLTELGFLFGNTNNSQKAPLSFNSFLNYQVTNKITAGVGSGVEFLKETYLPGLINLQFKFRNSWSAPFLFFEGGYLIPVEDSRQVYYDGGPVYRYYPNYANTALKAKGGIVINPGIGYQHMFSSSFGLSFSFGYRYNRLNYSGDKDYGMDIDYNRLSVKFGVIFK